MLILMELLLYQDKTMIRLIFYITIILIAISCSDLISNHPDLGKGYKFVHEGKYGLSIVNEKNTIVIQQHVLEYKCDSVFVLVAQRPFNSISGRDTMTYSEFNKEFKNSTFKQYWIIDKTQDNVYGPLLKKEYIKKRKELDVSEELKLDFEEEK
jgi:hypothetical protein